MLRSSSTVPFSATIPEAKPSRGTHAGWFGRRSRWISLLFVLTTTRLLAAEPPPAASTCDPAEARTVAIHMINAAGISPEMLAAATAETTAILERAAVRLAFTVAPASRKAAPGPSLVVILGRGSSASTRAHQPVSNRSDDTLGWVDFDENDRPDNLIRVSFDAIVGLVGQDPTINLRAGSLPDRRQEPLLGRAVGRVVAHELGHWLTGRQHTRAGLMSAVFRARDLMDWWSPQPPQEWSTAAFAQLRPQAACHTAAVVLAATPVAAAALPH